MRDRKPSSLESGKSARIAPPPLSGIERAANLFRISLHSAFALSQLPVLFYPDVVLQILAAPEKSLKDCTVEQTYVPAPELGKGFERPVTTTHCEPEFTVFSVDSKALIFLIQLLSIVVMFQQAKLAKYAVQQETECWAPTSSAEPSAPSTKNTKTLS